MLQMRRKQEEQRQKEVEEKKRKEIEAKRLRLEEAEKKRLAMQQAIKQRDEAARRSFIVKKTTPGAAMESGPIVFGMQDGELIDILPACWSTCVISEIDWPSNSKLSPGYSHENKGTVGRR